MSDYDISHHFAHRAYARRQRLAAGKTVPTHKHNFDHLSVLAGGRVVVDVDGVKTEFVAGDIITIKADKVHTITALEDVIWFCIHGTDITDPEQIDHELIKGD